MSYSPAERNSVQVLEIHDLLNEFDNRVILKEIEEKIQQGFHKFVLDLSKIDFMNSIGINFLLMALRKSSAVGGQLALASIPNHVINLLKITRLEPVFSIEPTVKDAIDSLKNE